jgi:hypothetical protein
LCARERASLNRRAGPHGRQSGSECPEPGLSRGSDRQTLSEFSDDNAPTAAVWALQVGFDHIVTTCTCGAEPYRCFVADCNEPLIALLGSLGCMGAPPRPSTAATEAAVGRSEAAAAPDLSRLSRSRTAGVVSLEMRSQHGLRRLALARRDTPRLCARKDAHRLSVPPGDDRGTSPQTIRGQFEAGRRISTPLAFQMEVYTLQPGAIVLSPGRELSVKVV